MVVNMVALRVLWRRLFDTGEANIGSQFLRKWHRRFVTDRMSFLDRGLR